VTFGGLDGSADPVPEDDSPGALELPPGSLELLPGALDPPPDVSADEDPAVVELPAGELLVSVAEPPPEQPATSPAAAFRAVTAASGRRPRIRDTGCLLVGVGWLGTQW
jgi:hypothetical protein